MFSSGIKFHKNPPYDGKSKFTLYFYGFVSWKSLPFSPMNSYVLKGKYNCGFGNTGNKNRKADTETKHYCWFRHSPGILSRRESKGIKAPSPVSGRVPPLKMLWTGCWSQPGTISWGLKPAEAAAPFAVGNNSVCVQCAEVQLPNRAPLGSAEEGLDNLAHLVSAELLITVQRQGQITTGNLRSSSQPQG